MRAEGSRTASSKGRPFVLAFTGPDGTGKSTQVQAAVDHLSSLGLRVYSVHQYAPIFSTTRSLKRRIRRFEHFLQHAVTRPGASVAISKGLSPLDTGAMTPEGSERPSNETSIARELRRRLVEAWWLWGGLWRAIGNLVRFREADVLILDRCFLDEMVRVMWKLDRGFSLGRLLFRFVPAPNLLVYLTIDETQGWARKKSMNIEPFEYRKKRAVIEIVMTFASERWNIRRIDVTPHSAQDVHRFIRHAYEHSVGWRWAT